MEKVINVGIIIDRLKHYLGIKTDTELAKVLKMKQTTLASWKGRNSFDINEIYSFCVENNINLHWLLTGEYPDTTLSDSKARYQEELGNLEMELKRIEKEIELACDDVERKRLEIEMLRVKHSAILRLTKLI